MAILHTHEFYSGKISGAGPVTLYTVPAGWLALIKHISLQNEIGTAKPTTIRVDSSLAIVSVQLPAWGTAGANLQWSGWCALDEGRVIRYESIAGAVCSVNVSGYLYFI